MKLLRVIARLGFLGLLGASWIVAGMFLYLTPGLPNVDELQNVKLKTPMRVYAKNGELIGQFGEEKRSPLRFDQYPEQFINALLAAEDDAFFEHSGVDLQGLMRAASELILTGQKGSGGSTLTMQVARNYFLTLKQTFIRKFREILLAIEIERQLSKEDIFELYANLVFLGHRAYGFEAAAQVYYGKGLAELSLAEQALLSGIPKAPSTRNPVSNPRASIARRNWILGRMQQLGMIDQAQYDQAKNSPDLARLHDARLALNAPYPAEIARQEMLERFGKAAYTEGYKVYLTIDPALQINAQNALQKGLIAYDSRHGYRGPERHINDIPSELLPDSKSWTALLEALDNTPVIGSLLPAAVISIQEASDEQTAQAQVLLADGSTHNIAWENGLSKVKPYISESTVGETPKTLAEILQVGDMIRVTQGDDGTLHFAQLPDVQGALVSLNPNNGAIIALVGGLGFELSKFNRATQAKRQPGSNFKPFLYSAALANGYTAASIINDAPVVVRDRSEENLWRPENDSGRFYGPTRLRQGLIKSRNLVSVRLLQELGISKAINYADKIGFDTSEFPRNLTLALGSMVITPLDLASRYAVLANGGFQVQPYLIERIEDSLGEVLYQAEPATVCEDCIVELDTSGETAADFNAAPRVMDERINYIINSILQDVITRGTGFRAKVLKRKDLAGKTGTTNGPMDAWFSGYSRDIVTTTWVGFDNYTPLGRREFGGTAALPIWIEYMREALKDTEEYTRPMPAGIATARIDPATGQLASSQQRNAQNEVFRSENMPTQQAYDERNNDGNDAAQDIIDDIF